ncbi:glycolipid transfer protein [Terfezia boudieri ATCC MYA-4762]|uniref:Glycolipid transfer protein n=1 Tax=Terfezia boudieri ATCC MYA-4762 TaxID=1051890 RepID=A0A3N4LTE0_9PEZI|nr:glycolipid transfer protein [Terfezia boudieri ATCC MYA-4762]
MATFFDGRRSFKDVETNGGINTSQFLEAAEGVVQLFDILGSTAFAPVKSDMSGNIKKIRDRQLAAPSASETLQSLTTAEQAEKKKVATEGLLWLNRGLDFTAQALRNNHTNSTEELANSFTKAYEATLKKHHGIMVRPIFALAMKACPYRNAFYKKLGDDQEAVKKELEAWLGGLEKCVTILNNHYEGIKI